MPELQNSKFRWRLVRGRDFGLNIPLGARQTLGCLGCEQIRLISEAREGPGPRAKSCQPLKK